MSGNAIGVMAKGDLRFNCIEYCTFLQNRTKGHKHKELIAINPGWWKRQEKRKVTLLDILGEKKLLYHNIFFSFLT